MTQPQRRAVRIAVANNKGGTGKTSATVNLAAALALYGLRILIIDMDPQGNAGRRLAADLAADQATLSDVLKALAEQPDGDLAGCATDAFAPIGWPTPYNDRITLIPSRSDLENRSLTEAGQLGAVQRLATALEGADDDYDLVLIDCPPNLGHLTQMALSAADYALAVMDPELDGIEGALALRDFVAVSRRKLSNPNLSVVGYIVNRVDLRVGADKYQVENSIPEAFGDELLLPMLPLRAAVKDAADSSPPRPLPALGSTGSEMAGLYNDLAKALALRVGLGTLSAEVV
ncbi:ParA family protein [Nonomuraea sp. NPDC050202]|uniref:ParA family protein n=1 Tax=Nonomuraea sp. NPDC050202 TaxID=3155035 RepID=UPI0033F5DB61